MPEPTTHPSRAELSAYNLGQLPPDQAAVIENHISECEPCCETIIGMSSDDTFVALLQEARQLPTDQTIDLDGSAAESSSSPRDIPVPLAEHPRYEIVGLIGRGGMGDVYMARHRMMKRTVALKIIKSELVRKPEAVDRFHREVTTAARLAHPNIVTSHDAEQAGDVHFLVMEYVDGVDLSQTVKSRGALPVAEACDYIRQAAIGLHHAHERGMVHRDIKPHNLMVTADGTVKILDFGLASLAPEAIADADMVETRGDLTAAGAIMGTPDFISPEQAEDAHRADIRSDIYSLGATLYFLLSGRPPFADGSVMHKLKSHAQADPEPLASLRDDVPPELVAVITKMTAKDPEQRYLTPSEVADALESFLRTWQPDGAEAREKEPSSGGNMSGSGGQKPTATDLGPDWLSAWAKWLFYISLLPIAVLVLDVFVLSDEASTAAADRVLYYLLASVCLSSVAGVLSGIHQSKTSSRDDHRIFRLTTEQTLIIAAILIGATVYFFIGTNIGGIRVDVTPPEDIGTLGTHPLTIVDTSGKKPLGGTSRTHQDDAAGITTHSFESANGRYKITLVDEVLTVNGDKYTLENPTDSIRIVDDRVEITRVAELPKDGEPLDGAQLLVGEWRGMTDAGEELRMTFNTNGTFAMAIVDRPRSQPVLIRATGTYTTDFSVSPVHLDLDATYDRETTPRIEREDPPETASAGGVPKRQQTEKNRLKTIIELVDSNTLRMGEPDEDSRPKTFSAVLHRQGVEEVAPASDQEPTTEAPASATKPVSECEAIRAALRKYYMDKYPLFAASVNQGSDILSDPRKLLDRETRRQIGELAINSPISEVINSFPGKPYVTFTEVTQASRDEVLVVCVNLYPNADGTCHVEVTKKQRQKAAGEPAAFSEPISEEEVRKLVLEAKQDHFIRETDTKQVSDHDRGREPAELAHEQDSARHANSKPLGFLEAELSNEKRAVERGRSMDEERRTRHEAEA